MASAFQCERCGECHPGPASMTSPICLASFLSATKIATIELCHDCCQDFLSWWQIGAALASRSDVPDYITGQEDT